ncbi:TPA: hypothetical protein OW428_002464 [Pseudomonas aeruginosa]|uniref:hypothetical protein n=1 Tax=Pseudomonas aeruginosa TaxID=287 RepID=UPI00066B8D0C|nr:hypothetical protein [Pseudomonas aeruginosa]ELL0593645.1 hypothetical protein [Pseudomonas aeruginosa]MBG4379513.1 hypothetical protein [Pseudomonas aeruginosa]MBI8003637.1 hypothetical protein [Pseudomonas aeruginosa]MBI8226158.1 hypothetical protein [Pseudomonas aeruginosa]MCO2939573.1 hypothetical protein [Pseudomonas aeruginosa]
MKKLLTGLFLAISAFPASFAVGVVVMQHTAFGAFPNALDAAAKTALAVLGLAVFVFCSGLVSKVDASKSAADAEQALGKK